MFLDFGKQHVLVVGDVMLHKFIDGSVERISPEAPVPILRHQSDRSAPGGAGNVAANIAALGAHVTLLSVTGEDAEGTLLRQSLAERAIEIEAEIDPTRPTIAKTRLMAANHQLMRIDTESRTPISSEVEERICDRFNMALARASVVIVSDYAKGLVTERVMRHIALHCRESHLKLFVDPKRRDMTFYRGADFITPNRAELSAATGLSCETDESAERAAFIAMEQTGAAILLTRSEKGMTLYRTTERPLNASTVAKQVFDVSGAGDTTIAAFALSVAINLPLAQAMRVANIAAGIVVGKLGTAVVARDELYQMLDPRPLGRRLARASSSPLPKLPIYAPDGAKRATSSASPMAVLGKQSSIATAW
jgi:D-beta-D-heptose 7-phosphate kinase/D-beta-D-heptose 1-phosphate adenosyltransferase